MVCKNVRRTECHIGRFFHQTDKSAMTSSALLILKICFLVPVHPGCPVKGESETATKQLSMCVSSDNSYFTYLNTTILLEPHYCSRGKIAER